jgi:hypothetical protein
MNLQKQVRCDEEEPEVRAILEASNTSLAWVAEEFASVDLRDQRLDRRLIKTAEQLARSPSSPINEACGSWGDTQAAYRLFDNAKASPEAILKPHTAETAQRIVAHGEAVLVVQDTVFFSYGQHPKTKGLGPIGKSNSVHERGLIVHNALAFTTTGVPLGILSQRIWAREAVPEEGYQEKIERLQCLPVEEKESSKWLLGLSETLERAPPAAKLVTVADRESDFFEFLTEAQEQRADFLIRARTDRKCVAEESEGYTSLLEALTSAAVLGTLAVEIPGNGKRKARTAEGEVRTVQVMVKAPQRRGKAQATTSLGPMSVHVIGVSERDPPVGEEALSWVLLTNLPVPNFKAAIEKIDWYTKRFGIEVWHKVLKSGCRVEDCLLETAERLSRYLTLFSILGVRLMQVAYLGRVHPERPANEVFSNEEIEALHVRVYQTRPPPEPIRLREAVRLLGRIGGHLGRKCDGEPGMTVIWRGWMRLHEDVIVIRRMKQTFGLTRLE